MHLKKGVKTRPSQNREEIKLFERSEFLILAFDDQVLAIFQPALDLFSIPFFYQEKTRNKSLERKEEEMTFFESFFLSREKRKNELLPKLKPLLFRTRIRLP